MLILFYLKFLYRWNQFFYQLFFTNLTSPKNRRFSELPPPDKKPPSFSTNPFPKTIPKIKFRKIPIFDLFYTQFFSMILGYARVSTQDQILDRQTDQLQQQGCE